MQDSEKRDFETLTDAGDGFIPLSSIGSLRPRLDIAAIREKLSSSRGRQYWRSLEQVAGTEEFQRLVEQEFTTPPRDLQPLKRRDFFALMGASLALAGIGGCAYQPPEKIVPYVEQPENLIPGQPLFFASAFPRGGYATGILAESHMGRPTKIEGNPQHPASKGATDVFAQASLLQLYDPDRSQEVRHFGNPANFDLFLGTLSRKLDDAKNNGGAGLRLVLEPTTSPTLISQIQQFLKLYPAARVIQHDPAGYEQAAVGAKQAFGTDAQPIYNFKDADVILSLDSDFLWDEPGSVRYARDFADGRRVTHGETKMNRLYVVESTVSITGANAEHRLPLKASDVAAYAFAILAAISPQGGQGAAPRPAGVIPQWIDSVAKDLEAARGRSLVVAGPTQPPIVHAIAHAINRHLGNVGATVRYIAPVTANFGDRRGTLKDLIADMAAKRIDTVLILGGNPAYTAPADLNFAKELQDFSSNTSHVCAHLSLYDDETSALCQWHLPQSHYLEAWSDARAYDGTASIIQPLIRPLYNSSSAHDILSILLRKEGDIAYDTVRAYWKKQMGGGDFEASWHKALIDGVIGNTASQPLSVNTSGAITAPPGAAAGALELVFRPDPHIGDGSFSNNGWLQELPKPVTTLTWDNAVLVSPKTAEAQHLNSGDMVELTFNGRKLRAAVYITPSHPEGTVTLHLGYGRTRAGKLGTQAGFNAYALRTSDAPWFGPVQLAKASGSYQLAHAQQYFRQHERELLIVGDLAELVKNPKKPAFMPREEHEPGKPETKDSLFPQMWTSDAHGETDNTFPTEGVGRYEGVGYNDQPIPAWGMVIDLNTCIGCNTCTIACQAENNISTVGKDQVANHRQMHWIRIDTYFGGHLDDPEVGFEPVPCMHCEKAPCEPVCPVEATSHSAEGINEMTYNRCIGTRYCSNNCPYKVRRFNYLQFADQKTSTLHLMRNPDVTVRSRGVMEKCTYCIQRVTEARIQAEKEDRAIRDGDVVPACAQACPTQAIVFGNINDTYSNGGKGSLVRQLKEHEGHNYTLLEELNTRPRTSYLARLRNRNPELPRREIGHDPENE